MKSEITDALARAVQKAQNSSFFLANVLNEFQQQNKLDNRSLAEFLGCEMQALSQLALCRCPNPNQSTFASDIDYLANRFNVQANHLANMIRQVAALHELRNHLREPGGKQRMLMAALDRDEDTLSDMGEAE